MTEILGVSMGDALNWGRIDGRLNNLFVVNMTDRTFFCNTYSPCIFCEETRYKTKFNGHMIFNSIIHLLWVNKRLHIEYFFSLASAHRLRWRSWKLIGLTSAKFSTEDCNDRLVVYARLGSKLTKKLKKTKKKKLNCSLNSE